MNENVVRFPSQTTIEEEAAAWLITLDGDDAPTAEQLEELREWLALSPANRQQLSSLATFWGKLNVLTELAVPLGHLHAQSTEGTDGRTSRVAPRFLRAGLIAATVVVGLGLAFSYWGRPDPIIDGNGLYATTFGNQQSQELADGSVVLLNTDTQIKVEFDDNYRNIYFLQGEAHFTVAKDIERPFRVYVGDRMVQAVGTAFSVYLKDTVVDVTVTEGQVALATVVRASDGKAPQKERPVGTLSAGESATIRNDDDSGAAGTIDLIEAVGPQDMAKRLSWREGMLTFNGDPLEVVVKEISRYTTVSIEFSDPALKATRIGGQFPIGETDAMFDALEANFQLKVTRLGDGHVLVSALEQ